jgi:eukaryotic-like serine/threonine-protein kinase
MKECPACRRCFPDHVNHCPDDGDATTLSIAGEPILDGRYQLERRLGHGGMGVVFQARHIFLKTAHAIKVILPDLVGNDPMLVTRFRQEALAAAAIRHQNIIAVTDFGVARGTMPFLVMEFVKGSSLHELLAQEGALPPGRALEIMAAVGAGVGAAHRQGIVHRDLKPLNIMMQEGQPVAEGLKVLDFGLAKIKSGELLGSFVQAKTSGLMGSPFYMAPEQWGDEEPDARADIYSLGVILFQMLGGDVPFRGTGIPSIMKKHLTQPPPSFASMGVSVPPQIEDVVRHALEKEAENRPPSVEAFINELREAVAVVTANLKSTTLGPMSAQPQTGSQPPPLVRSSGALQQSREMTLLRVQTNPPHARIFVNNVSVGASDQTGELVVPDMMPGLHSVRILHDGYAEWEQQIECSGGECRVNAQLQSLMQASQPPLGDPLAGTISSGTINGAPLQPSVISFGAQLSELEVEEQEQREREERDRIAREELEREEQVRLQAQAAARQREAEERRRLEEERRLAEEEERRKLEETARLKAAEEARIKAEEEESRAKAEAAEAEARRKAEAEATRQRAEAQARARADEEARRLAEEQQRQRDEEEARRKAAALEAQRKAAEEAERRKQEQREREEAERREAERRAAAERAAREQEELEERTVAARYETRPLVASDIETTQQQRQGVATGILDAGHSMPGVGQQTNWEQGQTPAAVHTQPPPFQSSMPGTSVVAPAPKKLALPLILVMLAFLLIGGGIGVYFLFLNKPATSNVNQNSGGPGTGEQQKDVIKPDLIAIAGGSFQMGRSGASILEAPVHSATVAAFSMDRTEVTNAEYEMFVRESGHKAPSHWSNNKPLAGQEQWPVTNVSYEDAVEFAEWRSKRDKVTYRLPTEEEWEFAARNGDKNELYPWGNAWEQGRAIIDEASPKPVGSLPNGKNRWGVVDLIGNVWEWTSSKAALYPGSRGAVPPEEREMMVYRGGSYATKMRETPATATVRNWQKPSTTHPTLGFRLVRPGS